jgi:hypothetical protein
VVCPIPIALKGPGRDLIMPVLASGISLTIVNLRLFRDFSCRRHPSQRN